MLLSTWAALLVLAAPPEPIELVVLPPEPQGGIKPDVAMQIWKSVVAEVDRSKNALGVSVKLQNDAKAALAGPARDQAWECKGELACLVDLGTTMGAGLILAGSVDKDSVSFLVVDVKAQRRMLGAKSTKKLERAGWRKQSDVAIKGVLQGLEKLRKAPPVEAPPPPEAKIDPSVAEIKIAASELADTKELTIDGLPIPKTGDGAVAWSGVPGRHVVVAVKNDGQRAVHELTLDGGKSLSLILAFGAPPTAPSSPPPAVRNDPPPPALVASAPPPRDDDDDRNSSPLWVWLAVGGAVVAGGTTAALLALGTKGGPSTDSATGSITGTY